MLKLEARRDAVELGEFDELLDCDFTFATFQCGHEQWQREFLFPRAMSRNMFASFN